MSQICIFRESTQWSVTLIQTFCVYNSIYPSIYTTDVCSSCSHIYISQTVIWDLCSAFWIPFAILLLSLPLLLCQPPSTGRRADGWEKESLPHLCQWSALWPSTNDVTHTSLMLQFPHVKLSWTRPLCGFILWKGVVTLKEKQKTLSENPTSSAWNERQITGNCSGL